jgi:hypothetical protein
MAKLFDLARVATATTGTGTITLGLPITGYLTFALAGASDGDTVAYGIADGTNSEVGTGVYTASGPTLTRTVTKSTNNNSAIGLSGSAQVFVTARAEDILTVLTANASYFVATTGSDTNNGTSGSPFLTIQKALNVVFGLNLGGFNATINVADGTYTGTVAISQLSPQIGAGSISIIGNITTPANVIVTNTADNTLVFANGVFITIDGMEIRNGGGAYGLKSQGANVTTGTHMRFGAVGVAQLYAQQRGQINVSTCSVVGGGASFLRCDSSAYVAMAGATITVTGTPAFSTAFVLATSLGNISATSVTFSGSATGTRYSVDKNALLDTGGGGASYFPGNAAGSFATGGQYV